VNSLVLGEIDKNYSEELIKTLEKRANKIRKLAIKMIANAQSGHPGGSLSIADIIAVLYFHILHHDPQNPKWEDRDRFILSKGHGCPALYAALAEAGYFPSEILYTFRKFGSILQGHPDMRKVPGIEMSSGSLGLGLSVANGIALSAKLDGKDYRVYVLLGDGELDTGIVWEAAMAASHYHLNNLTAIIDYNKLQSDGFNYEIMELEPLKDKWASFGWEVVEIDGHNIKEILSSIEYAKSVKDKPTAIIAHTIKGKGVSFMENQVSFHSVSKFTQEQLELALKDLGGEDE